MNVAQSHKVVAEAAAAYESRWTMRALLAHDPELYQDFREQQQLWCEALVTGEVVDVHTHTEGMCRAWAAIATALDTAEVPDDAYLIGRDDGSGVIVAISDQKAARARVEELYGEGIIFITPHEVATLLGRSDTIRALKGWFPGSELLGGRPAEATGSG